MMNPRIPSDIEATAVHLAQQTGLGNVRSIEPLPGGRNNRVYRVVGSSMTGILKHYHQPPGALHDRFATEMAWYQFCEQHSVRRMPRRWAVDAVTRSALFEEISGRKLTAGEVTTDHVREAVVYFADVNSHRDDFQSSTVPFASEACFSLADHYGCIERRIERLNRIPASDCLSAELLEWLAGDFHSVWNVVRAGIDDAFTSDERDAVLTPSERCLSPSDFGFHNALEDVGGRLWFLDFEYAGWDDPAKTICDFYWQVDVPMPRGTMSLWNESLVPFGDSVQRRIQALFPLIGLKWCLIVLNEFLRDGAERREFAGHAATVDRRHRQFALAQRLLDDVRTMTPYDRTG